jgi:hypothetical protein
MLNDLARFSRYYYYYASCVNGQTITDFVGHTGNRQQDYAVLQPLTQFGFSVNQVPNS